MLGCGKPEISREEVVVLGHGGAGFEGLNNSFVPNGELSIKQALLMQGADGVEVDVQLTKDSQAVLFHDQRLEGATNSSGFVWEKTWEELSQVKYKRIGMNASEVEHIWRLQDLFDFIDEEGLDVWLSINLHPRTDVEDIDAYNQIFFSAFFWPLERYSNRSKLIIESPNAANLRVFRIFQGAGLQLFYTTTLNDDNLKTAEEMNFDGFVTHYLDETEARIEKAKSRGFQVALYGIKIRQDIPRALKFRPDFVQTDNVPLMLSYLK